MRFSVAQTVLSSWFSSTTKRNNFSTVRWFVFGMTLLLLVSAASAQSYPPSQDAYIDSTSTGTNFGSLPGLNVSPTQSALVQFDLSSLPAGVTAPQISKATLRLFANTVSVAGAVDISEVTAPWLESTVTYATRPTVGATVALGIPITVPNTFILVDVTSVVQGWVTSPSTNDGLEITSALASPSTSVVFDSKENVNTSHEAELEILLVPGQPQTVTAQLWSAFVPAFAAKYRVSTFTPGSAITVTRMQAQVAVPPSNCKTEAVIQISDGTTSNNLTIAAAANDSGPLSLNYGAGDPVTLSISTPAQCLVPPLVGTVLVQYQSP